MKYTVHVGTMPIVLEHDDFDGAINADVLTKIDYSNIYGEVITAPAAANRIGMLKAEVEARHGKLKLDLQIMEHSIKSRLRKEAAEEGGYFLIRVNNEDVKVKLTEKSLESAHINNKDWISTKKKLIDAEKNMNLMASLYWAMQDKSRKVGGLTKDVTPEEFVSELVEGKVNGILIKK